MSDARYIALVREIATQSPDRSRKCGCVIVSPHGTLLSSGCNTFPFGVRDTEERHERPAKYKWIEHAERNAIYRAAREGISLKGATAYILWFPCADCARAIIQSGITTLVCDEPDVDDPTWGADFKITLAMLTEAGVRIRYDATATIGIAAA